MTLPVLKTVVQDYVRTCKRLEAKPRISLTGGNPLMRRDLWDFLAHLQALGIPVAMMGNARGLTDKVAMKLKGLGVDRFQLSLDGIEQTHDSLRSPGSFDATGHAIDILRRNDIRVSVMSTVSKINAKDIPALIEYVVRMKVNVYAFARYCPTHADLDNSFSPEEYRGFLSLVWDVFAKHASSGTEFILKDHLWSLFLMEMGLFAPEQTDDVVVAGCGLGISHMTILSDGTVYACRRFTSPLGRVPEDSLYDIFTGAKLDEYRDFSRLEKCSNCELLYHCRGCMAVTYGTTGTWTAADPQCWKK